MCPVWPGYAREKLRSLSILRIEAGPGRFGIVTVPGSAVIRRVLRWCGGIATRCIEIGVD